MRIYTGVCGVEHQLPDWVDVDALTTMVWEVEARMLDRLGYVEDAWDALGDVPVDDDGRIQTGFSMTGFDGRTMRYGVGTDREDIWHDIEAQYPVSVGRLMYGRDDE